MIKELITALEIRKKQFLAQAEGRDVKYPLHDGHHYRDIITTLAVLKNEKRALDFLKMMPTEKDLVK